MPQDVRVESVQHLTQTGMHPLEVQCPVYVKIFQNWPWMFSDQFFHFVESLFHVRIPTPNSILL